jgi:hypothetical protein
MDAYTANGLILMTLLALILLVHFSIQLKRIERQLGEMRDRLTADESEPPESRLPSR